MIGQAQDSFCGFGWVLKAVTFILEDRLINRPYKGEGCFLSYSLVYVDWIWYRGEIVSHSSLAERKKDTRLLVLVSDFSFDSAVVVTSSIYL